jgi:hypothetical protein
MATPLLKASGIAAAAAQRLYRFFSGKAIIDRLGPGTIQDLIHFLFKEIA